MVAMWQLERQTPDRPAKAPNRW